MDTNEEAALPTWDVSFDLRVDLGTPDVVRLVERSTALASAIRGLPIPPGVRQKLDRLNILRAVKGTTGIEGSDLTDEEVGLVLASPEGKPVLRRARAREEHEVRNARRVMDFTASSLHADPDAPLTEAIIATIHRLTTEGIDYPNNVPGEYRSHMVRAGTYVPPGTREEVRRLMSDFIEWVNSRAVAEWPAAITAIAAHFYFISIHPFGDGNGRTARAIESFLLYKSRLNVLGFYSLANFYYRRRAEYMELLDFTRFESGNNLTPFVMFALNGLVEELREIHAEVLQEMTMVAFRDFVRESLMTRHRLSTAARDRMYDFVCRLIEPAPIKDVRAGKHPAALAYQGSSLKTLRRDISFLRKEHLVVDEDGAIRANLGLMQDFMPD